MNDIWVRQNTKECPKCRVHIEKNQGCNHMTCRYCSHEFCWLCMRPYKTHQMATGRSICNQMDDIVVNALAKGGSSAKKDIEELKKIRLQKYYEKYEQTKVELKSAVRRQDEFQNATKDER